MAEQQSKRRAAAAMGSRWSELPPDLLAKVAQCLGGATDYVRLRAVCRDYRDLLPAPPYQPLPPQVPWLLLTPPPPPPSPPLTLPPPPAHILPLVAPPLSQVVNISVNYHTVVLPPPPPPQPPSAAPVYVSQLVLLDMLSRQHHVFPLPAATLPARYVLCGSWYGFLIFCCIDNIGNPICLNPVTRTIFNLPSFAYGLPFPVKSAFTVALSPPSFSRHPNLVECSAAAIVSPSLPSSYISAPDYRLEVIVSKPGHACWTLVPMADPAIPPPREIMFSETDQMFYGINAMGDMVGIKVGGDSRSVCRTEVCVRRPSVSLHQQKTIQFFHHYLVEFRGELFAVSRNFAVSFSTVSFDIFRLRKQAASETFLWERVYDLGGPEGMVAFVGPRSSFAIAGQPKFQEGGQVFFTDHFKGMPDKGVFDLATNEIQRAPDWDIDNGAFVHLPPLWYTPDLGQSIYLPVP